MKKSKDRLAARKKAAAPTTLRKLRRSGKTKRRSPPKKIQPNIFHVIDTKGEVFGEYKTRQDAWRDAVGPRFYKGFYIVEYVRCGLRRYDYNAASLKEVRDAGG